MAEPTQEDAKLLLQLYDLRREKVLRRARDFVQRDCKFKDYKDFTKRYPEGAKEHAYVGMALGYWDMACTLVVKGLLNEDLFHSTNFEHVALWYKFRPLVENWRKEFQHPGIMQAMETLASRHPAAAAFQPAPSKKKNKKGKGPKAKAAAAGATHSPHDDGDEDDD
ncbi:MAG: DUF4760 domain-containing protein [Acidobacteria bacterium]|nr:DUF4760 domain-containing protein [Acidobacteriota bacterium]